MFIPIADLPSIEGVEVCVIGAGAAGITIARRLGARGFKVVLCEGGTLEYTDESQDHYIGAVEGDDYFTLEESRLRYFGGSTNHWGGICRPLDAVDFKPRAASANTGWPIGKSDVDPFLQDALDILEAPTIADDQEIPNSGLRKVDFADSNGPVRFAEKYLLELERSQQVHVCLNANLISLEPDDSGIETATFATIDGSTKGTIRAKFYVLATGGIENSRLLLWCNELANGRVVKYADALGRYWAEHPNFAVAEAVVSNAGSFASAQEGKVYFAPTESAMQERGILNCRLSLALKIPPLGRAKKLIEDLACVAPAFGKWAFDLLDRQLFCGIRVRAAWEQEPVPENRISLSTERDSLQIPRSVLHWRKTALDFKTCRETALLLAEWFANSDQGRVRIADWLLADGPWPEDGTAEYHHIGGTRMASDPRLGVVDSNLQVFGMSNLYIAGSSVFPTGGYANSTLAIVQLSLRLADHLGHKLKP